MAAGPGRLLSTLADHAQGCSAVALSSDGRHIVSGSLDATIKVWDGKHYRRVPHVLIRSRVQSTHATPTEGSLREQQLLHFIYGCNTAEDAALGRRVLPHGTFPRVVKFLTG